MKNVWIYISPCIWFGIGVGLAVGGIFLTLIWTGHFTDLALVASSFRADDSNGGMVKEWILIIKKLSEFSFIAGFICLMVGLLKVQKIKRL
jgi:hypothetical protein